MDKFRLSDTYKLVISQILALLFLFVGFYFLDNTRKKSYETDIWHVVASESIALVEMQHPKDLSTYLDSSEFIGALKDLEGGENALNNVDELLILLDSAIQNPFLGVKNQVFLSLNATGSRSFSLSVYIPMDERVYLDPFSQLTSLKNAVYTRKYKGVDVHEYNFGNQQLSVAKIRNFLVASTDALWIEEAIRNNGEKFYDEFYFGTLNNDLPFSEHNIELQKGLKIWVRPSSVYNWFSRMTDLGTDNPFPSLVDYSNGMMVENIQEKKNELSFISHNRIDQHSFYQKIRSSLMNGKSISYKMMVDDVSFYERWYTNSFDKFVSLSIDYSDINNDTNILNSVHNFHENGFDLKQIIKQVSGDIFKATIINVDGSKWQHLYGYQLKNTVDFDVILDEVRREYEEESNNKVKMIGLKGFTIYGFPISNLSGALTGTYFSDKQSYSYVLRVNDFMVVSGDLPMLTQWLRDWLVKRRWVSQKRYNVLLQKIKSNNVNHTLVFNTEASWVGILHALSKSYAKFIDKHRPLILGLNYQVWSMWEDKLEMSALFSGKLRDDTPKSVTTILTKEMGVDLEKAPIVLTNILGDEEGILLIDKENIVEGYNFKGDTLFYHEFDSVIKAIPELLWPMNESLPSLFLTQNNQILQINREGIYLEGFPVDLPIYSQIEYTKWLPWHLRGSTEMIQDIEGVLLSVDTLGNIYGIDRKGNYQGKWQPQKTLERLALEPQIFQSNGNNYVVTLSKKGKLIVFTEKGEYVKGFPMLFREAVSSQLFVTEDATLEKSKITFITSIGDIVEVNGQGQVLRRDKLGDRAHGRSFGLLKDEARGRNWMVMEQIYGKIQIRNSSGKVVFKKIFEEEEKALGQYFDFGIDSELICITFPKSGKTYLYYLNGKMFIENVFMNSRNVNMFYDSDIQQFVFITSLKNKVEIHTIDRRN